MRQNSKAKLRVKSKISPKKILNRLKSFKSYNNFFTPNESRLFSKPWKQLYNHWRYNLFQQWFQLQNNWGYNLLQLKFWELTYYPSDPWSLRGLLFNCFCKSQQVNLFEALIPCNGKKQLKTIKEINKKRYLSANKEIQLILKVYK